MYFHRWELRILQINTLENLNKSINMLKLSWGKHLKMEQGALTWDQDMSSSESRDNKSWILEKKTDMLSRIECPFWLQGGLPEEGIDLFHAGSQELRSRTSSESQRQVDCKKLWRVISERGKTPMWPHYWRFVPTVIRNHKRHHSNQNYEGKDERQGGVNQGWRDFSHPDENQLDFDLKTGSNHQKHDTEDFYQNVCLIQGHICHWHNSSQLSA